MEHSRLDEYITACLRSTRLGPDRRQEAAEELRSHLEDRIAARCKTGLDAHQAVEAAINEFGSPRRIRKAFHRRQVILDFRSGWIETRKNLWQPVLYSAVLGVSAFGIQIRTGNIEAAIYAAFTLFLLWFAFSAGFMVVFSAFSFRLQRPVPRSEHRLPSSLLRWSFIVTAALAIVAVIAMASAAFLVNLVPPARFCELYLTGWLESPVGNLSLCALGTVGFGLAIAIHERRRCTEA